MSTKQETSQSQTQSNTFNPQSMNAYNTLTGSGSKQLNDLLNNDPFQSSFFNLQRGQLKNQLAGQASRNNWQTMQNVQSLGGNQTYNPFAQRLMTMNNRQNSADESAGNTNLLPGYNQMHQSAISQALGYQPLQTGGTSTGNSTQTTSGLGTWLPQLLGAGLGAATSFLGGGAKGGGGNFPGAGTPGYNPTNPFGSSGSPLGNALRFPTGIGATGSPFLLGQANQINNLPIGNRTPSSFYRY